MKKYNFYSGPAILPPEVLQQASQAVLELDGIGLSLIEISHRSKEFVAIIEESQSLIHELTGLGSEYHVLWLQGGATMQFMQIPLNLLNEEETAAYIEIGSWSKKAIKEAKLYGNVSVLASSAEKNFTFIPTGYTIPETAKYFHLTTNETIHGVQMHAFPHSTVPVVADMSSDIFSRQLDWKKFSLIYAGAQKNIGPSGATLVIVHESLLGTVRRTIPTILDYRNHIKDNSLHNTPSTFAIYVSLLTLRWLKRNGGIAAAEKLNRDKAQLLYNYIDSSNLYRAVAEKPDRSLMNVCWVLNKPELDEAFNAFAKEGNCIGIKGHRSVGGFRASLYNAMPVEGVQVLISVMKEFELKHS
jgi:phosphoserine aminotransferase